MTLPSFTDALTLFALCTLLSACTVPGTSREELDDLDDAASDASIDVSADLDGTTTDAHDADTVEPDTAQLPDAHDDIVDANDDDATASDQTVDTKTPIADGWCWLTGVDDVVCEDGSTTPLPASCDVYDRGIVIQHRRELYRFAALECTATGGDLVISQSSLERIDGLETLETIGGSLIIEDNATLHSLHGLSGLRTVGGSVEFDYNPQLTSLRGLNALEHIGQDLDLGGHWHSDGTRAQFESLDGLDALLDVGGPMTVRGAIRSLQGAANLRQVGRLEIVGTDRLTSLDGLEIERIAFADDYPVDPRLPPSLFNAAILLSDNTKLIDVAALQSLEANVAPDSPGFDVLIQHNPELRALDGLVGMRSLSIVDNAQLEALFSTTAPSLTSDASIHIENNPALTSLGPLTQPGSTVRSLVLDGGALTDLTGLEHLDTASTVEIRNLDSLASLEGLGHDETVFDSLTLQALPALTTGTTASAKAFWLRVEDCPQLTDLGGVELIDNGSGAVVSGVPRLIDLSFLSQVGTLQSDLELSDTGLTTLDALAGFEESWGELRLTDNAQLTDITGLSALHHVHGGLTVTGNPLLPQCQAETLADNLWVNGVLIENNDTTASCP